jgi:hypothetical protein
MTHNKWLPKTRSILVSLCTTDFILRVRVTSQLAVYREVAQLYHQALGVLFVASYGSQGYGGGIQPRLHTGSLPDFTEIWTASFFFFKFALESKFGPLARRPLNGLLYMPRVIMMMENLVE